MGRLALLVAAIARALRYTVGRNRCALCRVPSGRRRYCAPCLDVVAAVTTAAGAVRAGHDWGLGARGTGWRPDRNGGTP